jgi:hypothetical protein
MASFILYTYQCAPITKLENKLFESLPSMKERMDNKQEYIHTIITNEKFQFRSKKDGEFKHRIRYVGNGC